MKRDNLLNILLIIFPIIDFVTSICTWNSWISVGTILKGIFLIYAIFIIVKQKPKKKIYLLFLILLLYSLTMASYWFLKNPSYLKGEITNFIKIYYLPILILFFGINQKVKKSTFLIMLLEYLLLYLLPYPFRLGHNINEIYPNKNLYLSYFYVGNELANVFILLLPASFSYLLEEKKKLLPVTCILTIFMLLLLGTKTTYLSIIIIFIYFIIYYRKELLPKIKKYGLQIGIVSLVLLIVFALWFPKSSIYQNIKTQFEFYKVDNLNDLFTLDNVNNIVYSNRLTFLKNIHKEYKSLSTLEKSFGMGRTKILEEKDVEIDLFDIFYSVGYIGIIVYIMIWGITLKTVEIHGIYKFTFILLCIISLFSGHVLISPMTTTYLASLFGVERKKYETLDKKANAKNSYRALAK